MANAKTLRKRIALVAAAAVGVGMLVAAPASAVAGLTSVTTYAGSGTTTTTSVSTAVGTAVNVAWYATTAGTPGASDVVTYTPSVTTSPKDSGIVVAAASSATAAASGQVVLNYGAGTAVTGWTEAASTNAVTDTVAGSPANLSAANRGNVSINPDKPGVYTITITTTSVAGTGSTAVITVYAGYSADSTHANTAFPTQGVNTTSGWTALAGGLATVRLTNFNTTTTNTHYYVTVSGATMNAATIQSAANGIVATNAGNTNGFNNTNGTNLTGGIDFWTGTTTTATTASSAVDIQISSATTGTATVNVVTYSATTGAPTTFSAPVATFISSSSTALSVANSTVYASATIGSVPAADDTSAIVVQGNGAATQRALIAATLKDGNSNALNAQSVSVTVTGPGTVGIATDGTTRTTASAGRAVTVTLGATNVALIAVWSDGTAGATSITVSSGSTTLAKKTLTFYGAIASIVPTVNAKLLAIAAPSGTNSNTGAITVVAKDANGTTIPTATVYATSGTASVIGSSYASVSITSGSGTYSPTGLAAGTAAITFSDGSTAAGTTVTSTPVTLTVAPSVLASSITLAFDKSSYNPGDKMTVTLTAKDANGNLIADSGAGTYALLGSTGLTFSASGSSTLPTNANVTLANGVATYTVYAPLVAGPVSVNGVVGATGTNVSSTITGAALTASATVVAAANADIAAAKAAADAATAAVATLSTTVAALVASITAQIKALSALVKKIMTKLKIK